MDKRACTKQCYKMPLRWRYDPSGKYRNPHTGRPLWVVTCRRCGKFVGYAYAKPDATEE